MELITKPVIFNPAEPDQLEGLNVLLQDPQIEVADTYASQVAEWIKISNPSVRIAAEVLIRRSVEWIENQGLPALQQGRWVYYPWRRTVVHILDPERFIALRTSRNQYKITSEEQISLSTKTVGVIGLSVGQSVSVTMAMERTAGTLRLADFDELELSNMNRMRASLTDLGLPKVVLAARQIAEQDPYLQVEIYPEGITDENMDGFLSGLDLLVEECDSLEIKLAVRKKARALKLPVLMDTSDRGMLDVERFDLEPERPLFHGKVPHLDTIDLTTLGPQERLGLTLQLVEAHAASDRAKYSLSEIGKSITTWPQLASSVVAGGGFTTEMARKILLGHSKVSGRFHVELDAVLKEGNG